MEQKNSFGYGVIGPFGEEGDFKRFLGLALVIIGVIISLWVFTKVCKIFTAPQEIKVFEQIMPESSEWRELEIEGKKVVLPVNTFRFIAYGIGSFLLLVAAIVAGGLISGGVGLLQKPTPPKIRDRSGKT